MNKQESLLHIHFFNDVLQLPINRNILKTAFRPAAFPDAEFGKNFPFRHVEKSDTGNDFAVSGGTL